jgi:hypothetical protein
MAGAQAMTDTANPWLDALTIVRAKVLPESRFWQAIYAAILDFGHDTQSANNLMVDLNKDATLEVLEMLIRLWSLKEDPQPIAAVEDFIGRHNALVEQELETVDQTALNKTPPNVLSANKKQENAIELIASKGSELVVPRPFFLNVMWFFSANTVSTQLTALEKAGFLQMTDEYYNANAGNLIVSHGQAEGLYLDYLNDLKAEMASLKP